MGLIADRAGNAARNASHASDFITKAMNPTIACAVATFICGISTTSFFGGLLFIPDNIIGKSAAGIIAIFSGLIAISSGRVAFGYMRSARKQINSAGEWANGVISADKNGLN